MEVKGILVLEVEAADIEEVKLDAVEGIGEAT